jgi:Rne/Rng family ribonuclease
MSKRKIVVSERDNIAAVFEDEQAVEFIINRGSMLLGDVYLATVENILPSIDAAFVNVGGDKMGFLHSSDVHMGKGDLRNRLQPKQQILVQVMKEPTGHKGPRVTTNISLPGRFLVLMPESKGISISRKIEQQSERSRLKSLVSSVKPQGVGIIIRTEADQQKESDIQEDLETLLERWQNIVSMSDTSQAPTLLYRDQDLLYRVIREAVSEEVRELWVDTSFGASRASQLLSNWNLDRNLKVQQYTGQQSILVAMGVEREIKLALQTKVPLPNGGYLYIQPTEALTVVDVNSGKFTSLASQAETIRLTNLEAVKEIARQLRLRNIGGMIIIDFIDMESRADKLEMMESLEEALAPDKAKPQIGQLSDLGLVELTRHRQGQALSEIFTRRCIACNGSGHAIEEFSWATPTGDNRFRPGGFNRGGFQQQQQGRKPLGHPAQANRRFGGPQQNAPSANQNLALKPVLQQVTVALTERPLDTTPLIFKPANPKPEAETKVEKTLEETLRDKLIQKVGIRFASMVQVGCTPPEANANIARMNPKANDVLTLIRTIQTTGGLIDDMDDDDNDGMSQGDDEDNAPERRPAAVAVATRPAALPRIPADETDDVVSDDDDEGDNVPSSQDQSDEPPALRSRRRGRPPKARKDEPTEEAVFIPNGALFEHAESLPDDDTPDNAPEEATSPPRKTGAVATTKRRRGRPPKRPTPQAD